MPSLETNGITMGRSLKSASGCPGMPADHPLGSLLGGFTHSKAIGLPMLPGSTRMSVGWLKADEHALAGGLASKLSEAEGRAIKLLTPPKPADPDPILGQEMVVDWLREEGATHLGGVVHDR